MRLTAQAKEQALRLGLATFLACLLTSALFVAPLLATHDDFNHRHNEGTSPHVHTINGLLGNPALGEPVAAAGFASLTLYILPHRSFVPPRAFSLAGPNIRAPPHS